MGNGHALHFGNNQEASIHNENEEAEERSFTTNFSGLED